MESDTQVFLAKQRWQELDRRTFAGISIDRVLTGNSWCNPSVRFLFERLQQRTRRQAWFPFGRETLFFVMEHRHHRALENMNLGIDMGSWLEQP